MSQADPGYRAQNDSVIAAASGSRGLLVCRALTAAAVAVAEGSLCTRAMSLAAYFFGGESDDPPYLLVEDIRSQSLRGETKTQTPRSNHQDCLFLLLGGGGGNVPGKPKSCIFLMRNWGTWFDWLWSRLLEKPRDGYCHHGSWHNHLPLGAPSVPYPHTILCLHKGLP